MPSERQLFLHHVAQTSDFPLSLEIEKAKGLYLYDKSGKKYLDLISGISVSNLGHCHPEMVAAVKSQVEKYAHVMVYGEYIQSPQVQLAEKLSYLLPENLHSVYFVNSGAEATEGAMKLAKRYTGRTEIISCYNSYHGSTQGALSIMGNESLKRKFRPLLPDIRFIGFNNEKHLEYITNKTACVIIEPVQGEAGVILPEKFFLKKLRAKCDATGTLLIFDEAQTAFGRTGSLFALERFNVIPDVLLLAKAFGGGMPLGAFVSSKKIMDCLKSGPALGHITTFGGHPVSCASALASMDILLKDGLVKKVNQKEKLFRKLLRHKDIREIRSAGLMLAVEFESSEKNQQVIRKCLEKGLITDWFLFCDKAMRIAPPLIISEDEIEKSCGIILESISNSN